MTRVARIAEVIGLEVDRALEVERQGSEVDGADLDRLCALASMADLLRGLPPGVDHHEAILGYALRARFGDGVADGAMDVLWVLANAGSAARWTPPEELGRAHTV